MSLTFLFDTYNQYFNVFIKLIIRRKGTGKAKSKIEIEDSDITVHPLIFIHEVSTAAI